MIVWLFEMVARYFGGYKGSLLISFGVAAGAMALTWWMIWHDDRAAYITLPPGKYHPSFFREYDIARRNHAGWLTDPYIVAQKYAGITNLCPSGVVQKLPTEPGRAIYLFTNKCWGGMFTAKKYRVDLVEQGGIWEIEWSGVQYRCSHNPDDPGSILLTHNPIRQYRNPLAVAFNNGIKSVAYNINPWRLTCP